MPCKKVEPEANPGNTYYFFIDDGYIPVKKEQKENCDQKDPFFLLFKLFCKKPGPDQPTDPQNKCYGQSYRKGFINGFIFNTVHYEQGSDDCPDQGDRKALECFFSF